MGLILSLDNSIHSFNRAGFVGLLDEYTGAAAGYSLRRLSVNTTNVIRVRRSSDNAEADFTADEITDGTLLAWVGNTASDNGFVTTWYDQSGNSNDATQGTAASQPKIVDAGVLVEDNGKPAIIYDDVDDFFSINSLFTNADGEHSVYSVINQNNLEGTILGIVSVGGYYFRYTSTSPSLLWYLPNTTNAAMSLTGPTGQGLISLNIGGGTAYAYVNNTLNNSISSTGPLNNYPNGIGRYAGGEYFGGYMQEIVAYEVNTISSRNDINTNINDYYSIYP